MRWGGGGRSPRFSARVYAVISCYTPNIFHHQKKRLDSTRWELTVRLTWRGDATPKTMSGIMDPPAELLFFPPPQKYSCSWIRGRMMFGFWKETWWWSGVRLLRAWRMLNKQKDLKGIMTGSCLSVFRWPTVLISVLVLVSVLAFV